MLSPLEWEEGITTVITYAPMKHCFFVCCNRLGLMDTKPSQVEVLKVEALDVQSKPLVLRKKLRVWSSLQILWLWARSGVYDECISAFPTHFNVGYFLIHSMYTSLSAYFWISFISNCSLCSCTFRVYVGRGKFRKLLCCHLAQLPSCFPFYSIKSKLFYWYWAL